MISIRTIKYIKNNIYQILMFYSVWLFLFISNSFILYIFQIHNLNYSIVVIYIYDLIWFFLYSHIFRKKINKKNFIKFWILLLFILIIYKIFEEIIVNYDFEIKYKFIIYLLFTILFTIINFFIQKIIIFKWQNM